MVHCHFPWLLNSGPAFTSPVATLAAAAKRFPPFCCNAKLNYETCKIIFILNKPIRQALLFSLLKQACRRSLLFVLCLYIVFVCVCAWCAPLVSYNWWSWLACCNVFIYYVLFFKIYIGRVFLPHFCFYWTSPVAPSCCCCWSSSSFCCSLITDAAYVSLTLHWTPTKLVMFPAASRRAAMKNWFQNVDPSTR